MKAAERDALKHLTAINWALSKDSVWVDPVPNIAGLNMQALTSVMEGFDAAKASEVDNPIGVVVTGRPGSGKTHLVATVRSRVSEAGGYFFALDLRHERSFWQKVVLDVLDGLMRPGRGGVEQGEILRDSLSRKLGLPESLHRQLTGQDTPTRSGLDGIVEALDAVDRQLAFECGHTLRALALSANRSPATRDVAISYLLTEGESVVGERAEWGIRGGSKTPHEMVSELFKLIALTGPSVIALDQIDTLIQQSDRPADPGASEPAADSLGLPRKGLFEDVGSGIMELREATRRTLVLVACMDSIWRGIEDYSPGSVGQRFRRTKELDTIPAPKLGLTLIERRFALKFREVGFTPPYLSWPVRPEAFADADQFTARSLIRRVDEHVRACLAMDAVVELTDLARPKTPEAPTPQSAPAGPRVDQSRFDEFDRQLTTRMDDDGVAARIAGALDKRTEDQYMPELMRAALTCWVAEQGGDHTRFEVPGTTTAAGSAAVHAELRQTLNEDTDDKIVRSFRAIAWSDPRAVINRIDRFTSTTGIDPTAPKRRAYLLRTGPWPNGRKTWQKIQEFGESGGIVIELSPEDLEHSLRTFAALDRIAGSHPSPEFRAWLHTRRPAGRTALLRAVFGDPGDEPEPSGTAPTSTTQSSATPEPGHVSAAVGPDAAAQAVDGPTTTDPATLTIGVRMDTDAPVTITLESLRKHTAIFAGSGSGKTVLIRRIVEECALRGVSAIVLDPNNDLARLGDAWPEPPDAWGPHDAARAKDYLAGTDVVVWTPRRESGRPLTFRPLPDFAAVRDDPDEFRQSIDTAVAALAPRARADGTTAKAELSRAVLNQALQYFAQSGSGGLGDFLDLLDDLPDGVASLDKAHELAGDMAQTLRAAMINDPLFGGEGEPLDPGALLTPADGKRARVSVISLVGLPAEEQRQSFVNQLQMALFAWIKRNPAGDRPLGGLLVMDEAQTIAPSGSMTASTHSTLALASQARKYGLGLVVATQAPRGIHNRISGNAATQFFGFLNSPPQIGAAKELAAAKSSAVPDISRLATGQFYAVGEGMSFQKIRTPICLSHHPASPLTADEVIDRARRE